MHFYGVKIVETSLETRLRERTKDYNFTYRREILAPWIHVVFLGQHQLSINYCANNNCSIAASLGV